MASIITPNFNLIHVYKHNTKYKNNQKCSCKQQKVQNHLQHITTHLHYSMCQHVHTALYKSKKHSSDTKSLISVVIIKQITQPQISSQCDSQVT